MIIKILVATQQLIVFDEERVVCQYQISTGKKGLGEQRGSNMTPRGWHYIRAKIGADYPPNTVFVARRPTGEVYSSELAKHHPDRDWILTRILWLCGLEKGVNRLGLADTFQRFIYIHGTPDELPMGVPLSHGCIRMRNQDIIELYNLVEYGTRVFITV